MGRWDTGVAARAACDAGSEVKLKPSAFQFLEDI